MAKVLLKDIKKVYNKDVVAVQEFNLEIRDKEFIVLVGPSGCGKSTTLRMVAGLEGITAGELYIGDRFVNDVAPKNRDIAMVFQNYALYPHMTVYENMAFALKLRKMKKQDVQQMVNAAAEILGISELLERKPKALSGGQRQRVAIGRAIVREPQVFLMDEPLSNLDAKLRNQMRAEIIKLRERINTTFIYVTHDQTEAMTLGDRIVIMKDGFVQQIGTPQEVFNFPSNLFVAGFIGTPQMNFFDARLKSAGGKFIVEVFAKEVMLSDEVQAALREKRQSACDIVLGIRPQHINVVSADTPGAIKAKVDVSEMMGSEMHLHVSIGEKDAVVIISTVQASLDYAKINAQKVDIYLEFSYECLHLFNAETKENLLKIEPEISLKGEYSA